MKAEIEHILNTGNIEERLNALLDILSYGEDALNLAVDALYNSSREVRSTACWLLQDRQEAEIKTSLINYCPYI